MPKLRFPILNIAALFNLYEDMMFDKKKSFTVTVLLSFSDLIDDWSSKTVPDVVHFVPYTYNINILINQFELVTLCNEWNWIDTSSHNPENGEYLLGLVAV